MEIPFHQKTYSKRMLRKHDLKSVIKNFSLPTFHGEETVKIKGLHYVNQGYVKTKIFLRPELWILLGRFLRNYILQES